MKRTTTILTAILLTASFTFFCSCKKSYKNTDQLATLGSTTISGTVYAILADTIGATGNQYAPAGTVINAWIDSREFLFYTDSIAPYARKYYTATVDANGKYFLTVDVSLYQGAIVNIEPAGFKYNQVRKETSAPYAVYTVTKTYTSIAFPVGVVHDSSSVQDIMYTFN